MSGKLSHKQIVAAFPWAYYAAYCHCHGATDDCQNPVIRKDEHLPGNSCEADDADDFVSGVLELSPDAF